MCLMAIRHTVEKKWRVEGAWPLGATEQVKHVVGFAKPALAAYVASMPDPSSIE